MQTVNHSAIVSCAPSEMFQLVNDIGQYPEFIQHCSGAHILQQTHHHMIAHLHLTYLNMSHSLVTRNQWHDHTAIDIQLVESSFVHTLQGQWKFTAIGNNACRVSLVLHFTPSLLANIIGRKLLPALGKELITVFSQRAHAYYSK